MTEYKRGSIWYVAKAGETPVGSEQYAGRPAIIVSNDLGNALSDTVEVVYLTSRPKTDMPTHAVVRSTQRVSTALCEQVNTVSKSRIGTFIAVATPDEMRRIDIALSVSLGLGLTDGAADEEPQEKPEAAREDAEIRCIRLKAERDTYRELYERLLREMLAGTGGSKT